MKSTPGGPIDRRRFLQRLGGAGLTAGAAVGAGLWFHEHTPTRPGAVGELASVPDFHVPGTEGRMSIARGGDRKQSLRRAVEALGGMETFVAPGDRVLLKVNAAFATAPMLGATTHPDLLEAVVRLCYEAGAKDVAVADNPINDPPACFELTGIRAAAEAAGARVVLPTENLFRPTTLEGGRLIVEWPLFHGPLAQADKVIGLAPVKDHFRSGASMTMKNWYGLLGGRRNIFHQNINDIIMELALMVRPTLVILDGTVVMMHNGPTGGSLDDLKTADTIVVSTDPVAADAFGATLLERRAVDLPYLAKAAQAGAGTDDFESLDPVRVRS